MNKEHQETIIKTRKNKEQGIIMNTEEWIRKKEPS